QWAVERADDLCAQILERATNTDYGIGVSLDARDLIARPLAEAAKPKVQPMETAPKDGTKIALLTAGNEWVAPCEWQEGGVISEEGFWLHWNFTEGSHFNE